MGILDIMVKRIRRRMAELDIQSESELSRRAKVGQKTINNLLNPERFGGSPTLDTVEKVAGALRMPVADLFAAEKTSETSFANYIGGRVLALPVQLREKLLADVDLYETLGEPVTKLTPSKQLPPLPQGGYEATRDTPAARKKSQK